MFPKLHYILKELTMQWTLRIARRERMNSELAKEKISFSLAEVSTRIHTL